MCQNQCVPNCWFFNSFHLSRFGAGKLLETFFLCGKRKLFSLSPLLQAPTLSLSFGSSPGCSPHLIPFLNPGYPPLELCSKSIRICSAWLLLFSQYPPALWHRHPSSAVAILFGCLSGLLSLPCLHPLPRTLTFSICLWKSQCSRETCDWECCHLLRRSRVGFLDLET